VTEPSARRRAPWRACLLFALALPTATALARAPEAPTVLEDEIVVLGARSAITRDTLAGAPVAFDAEDLETARGPFVAELLRTVPSASVSRSGAFGGLTQVRLRGSEGNHTLVLLDGFELNDPANGSEFDFAHLRGTTVERVELLPGPTGALWGSDALAGAIALSTPTARSDGLDAGLRLAAGDHGTGEGTLRLGYRGARGEAGVVLDRFETDGTNLARAGDERDGYSLDTLAFSGRLALSDRLALRATLRHVDAAVEFDPAPFPAFVPVDGDRETDLSRTLVGLRAEYETDGGWMHALGLEAFESDYDDLADGVRQSGRGGERRRVFLQSALTFEAALPGTQHLTLLGEVEREEFTQDGTPSPFGNPNQRQAVTHRSLLAEWRWASPGGVHLFAAGRADRNDSFRDAHQLRLGTRVPVPGDRGDLWASWATATKNPGFTERFGFTPDTFLGNAALRPERSRALEIGWRGTLVAGEGTDDRVTAELVWHRTRLEDEIDGFVFDPATFLFTAANRATDSRRDGVEATLTLAPVTGARMTLRYAFLDASEPDATGQVREIRRPRHAAGLNLVYRPAPLPLTLRVDVAHVGQRRDRDFATFPATVVELDAFTTVDLAASWTVGAGLEVFVRADDLFSGNDEEVFGFAAPGQTLRAGFEYRMR
jgi:vitamin B12 transporter